MLRYHLPGDPQHLFGGAGVQGGGVLVQQQQLWGDQRSHEQGEGLPLPAGQQPHRLPHPVLQAHLQSGQLVPEQGPVRLAGAAEEGVLVLGSAEIGQGQILLDGHVGGGPPHGVLEQAAQHPAAPVLRLEGDVLPRQGDGALIHIEAPGDGVEQGALARAVGAHDGDEVPGLQVEGQAAEGLLLIDRAGVEGLGDMFQLQHVTFLPSPLWRRPCAAGRRPTAGPPGPRWPRRR